MTVTGLLCNGLGAGVGGIAVCCNVHATVKIYRPEVLTFALRYRKLITVERTTRHAKPDTKMGVAAYNRGNKVISRQHSGDAKNNSDLIIAAELTEKVNAWRRNAWSFFIDAKYGDAGGFLVAAIVYMLGRNSKRTQSLIEAVAVADRARVNAFGTTTMGEYIAALDHARAVYKLIMWLGGDWASEHKIITSAPRCVSRS